MRRYLHHNGLGLFFGLLFLLAVVGQVVSGRALRNQELVAAGLAPLDVGRYLTSSSFAVDLLENWQSEYLQFLLYLMATVWLVQRGSPESKELDQVGRESDEDQEVGAAAHPWSPGPARRGPGPLRWAYENSLGLVMGTVFLGTWLAQSVAGVVAYNEEQLQDLLPPLSWREYLVSPDFWSRTLQNWQSEFLAVGSMAVLSVYLRQRGSPESKPVGAAHDDTAAEG
ncbi:DUF6766 family protein [Vallicoccus soli]|uniref:Uncharacterized protein n=1 Tax=Vallicoccus soli TaxID=2339232 RepID=A0A3A3YMJ5_9ACTN|nr:DUF6766 family protein [Vallicoccus soli]RJK92639.1 hypothetical protein D5H78_18570 [Vallicoccus soli]